MFRLGISIKALRLTLEVIGQLRMASFVPFLRAFATKLPNVLQEGVHYPKLATTGANGSRN